MNLFAIILFLAMFCVNGIYAEQSGFWSKVDVPAPYDSGYFLDIYFLESNPQYGWACGFNGFILRTTDAGNTWNGSRVFDGSQGPFLESIHFVSPLVGFTSGPGGVYKTIDGGNNWKDITAPFDMSQIWGCYFVDENTGLYVGGGCVGDNQVFMRTSDGGNTWNPSFGYEFESGMSDLILKDPNGIGYAVSSGVLWRTVDGGKNWAVLSYTGPKYWSEEISHKGNSFLIPTAGSDCSGGNRNIGSIRFSNDRGGSWKEFQTNKSMFGAYLLDDNRGWACGDEGIMLYTSNSGIAWESRNCGLNGANIDDICFVNDSTGWGVGEGLFRYSLVHKPDSLIAYPSQPLCSNEVAILSIPGYLTNIRWSNGSSLNSTIASKSDIYYVAAYDSRLCSMVYDTVKIDFLPQPNATLVLSSDSILCDKEILELTVKGSFISALWSDGSTNTTIIVQNPGIYSVTITDSNGCTVTLQSPLIVKGNSEKVPLTVSGKTILCKNESSIVSAPSGFITYEWNTGEKTKDIQVKKAGVYFVTVTDKYGCNSVSDSIIISVLDIQNALSFSLINAKELQFDSVEIGNVTCYTLNIKNENSKDTLFVPLPYVVKNIVFSIPQEQFPLVISPQDSINLSLCFSPSSIGVWKDTIIFHDTCSPFIMPLCGVAKANIKELDSECNVFTVAQIVKLGNVYGSRLQMYPNPTIGEFTIPVYKDQSVQSVSLISLLGESFPIHLNNTEHEKTHCIIPIHYPNGIYAVMIKTQGLHVFTGMITLNR